jgi:hypothetical protein
MGERRFRASFTHFRSYHLTQRFAEVTEERRVMNVI